MYGLLLRSQVDTIVDYIVLDKVSSSIETCLYITIIGLFGAKNLFETILSIIVAVE